MLYLYDRFMRMEVTVPLSYYLSYILFCYVAGLLAYKYVYARPEVKELNRTILSYQYILVRADAIIKDLKSKLPKRDSKGRFLKND